MFIDGNYLEKAYASLLLEFMGNAGDLDVSLVATQLKPVAERVFYYHALDEVPQQGETDDAFRARIQPKTEHGYQQVSLNQLRNQGD